MVSYLLFFLNVISVPAVISLCALLAIGARKDTLCFVGYLLSSVYHKSRSLTEKDFIQRGKDVLMPLYRF